MSNRFLKIIESTVANEGNPQTSVKYPLDDLVALVLAEVIDYLSETFSFEFGQLYTDVWR